MTDGGTWRPLLASYLTACLRSQGEMEAFADDLLDLGYNGWRTFLGDLEWCGQTPADALRALPTLLEVARERGMVVYACALTGGAARPYDMAGHLREVADICAAFPNVLLEGANEVGHGSLGDFARDPGRLLDVLRRVARSPWTVGAPVDTDEMLPDDTYPTAGGQFNDAHLSRGRDLYNQVRRVREIAGVGEALRTAVISGEPIGIAEEPMPGKQRLWGAEAQVFSYLHGLLCRGFEVGCVFHSEDGLWGRPLGPNTRAAAQRTVDGWRALPTEGRLRFYNARWAGSPVADADFDHVVRAYSFVRDDRGWTALVGLSGDPAVQWGGGWRPTGHVQPFDGVQVVEIVR